MHDVLTILYHYIRTKRLMGRFKTREALEAWQQKRLHHFMHNIVKDSPFYRSFTGQPLHQFPLMDKTTMMEHFDALNTVGLSKNEAFDVALKSETTRNFSPLIKGISVGLSSGTSGARGLFVASKKERLLWAGIMLAKALDASIFCKQNIAFFLRANNNLYQTLAFGRHIAFRFFDLLVPVETHSERLQRFQPSILVAPASVLKILASMQQQGMLQIAPKKIFSVAEVLEDADKRCISKTFGVTVHQIYQCTEGFLAITDQQGVLQLNEEFVHVEKEWIDKESGRFVPIITDFTRITQPIIRYRLNDVLIEDRSDIGVYTRLSRIEGRCDDHCSLPLLANDKKRKVIFADFISRAIISASEEIQDYFVIQTGERNFDIALKPQANHDMQQKIKASFGNLAAQLGCHMPVIHFTAYHSPPLGQKLRRVQNQTRLQEHAV